MTKQLWERFKDNPASLALFPISLGIVLVIGAIVGGTVGTIIIAAVAAIIILCVVGAFIAALLY